MRITDQRRRSKVEAEKAERLSANAQGARTAQRGSVADQESAAAAAAAAAAALGAAGALKQGVSALIHEQRRCSQRLYFCVEHSTLTCFIYALYMQRHNSETHQLTDTAH
jgi:hypothetical protein